MGKWGGQSTSFSVANPELETWTREKMGHFIPASEFKITGSPTPTPNPEEQTQIIHSEAETEGSEPLRARSAHPRREMGVEG